MHIVLKRKHRSQWFDPNKQFVDANKIRDFFATNSNLRIRFHEVVTSVLGIFTNSFTQTLFLSPKLRILSCEFVRVFSMFCCEWPILYVSLYGDEWKNRSSGIYYLKSLETLVNSNLQIYPMEFYSVRKGLELWRRLTNQILSHKASFGPFSLTPHSSYPKHPPSKIDYLKRNQTKS